MCVCMYVYLLVCWQVVRQVTQSVMPRPVPKQRMYPSSVNCLLKCIHSTYVHPPQIISYNVYMYPSKVSIIIRCPKHTQYTYTYTKSNVTSGPKVTRTSIHHKPFLKVISPIHSSTKVFCIIGTQIARSYHSLVQRKHTSTQSLL